MADHSSTVEQYVKTIYREQHRHTSDIVHMKSLATAMHVSPSTATIMAQQLDRLKLAIYKPRMGVTLTGAGRLLALKMIRRHRLIESFLQRTLNYDLSEVHPDAERLEHAVSDRFIQRIDALLDHPTLDPHGDPIPTEAGRIHDRHLISLSRLPIGSKFTVARLVGDTGEFLELMKRLQIVPDMRFELIAIEPAARIITLRRRSDGRELTIGSDLGDMIQTTGAEERHG